MVLTFKNDFHNSEINLNVKNWRLSASQVKRAKKVLCGIKGCTCSDFMGCRGPQALSQEGHIITVEENRDGSGTVRLQ